MRQLSMDHYRKLFVGIYVMKVQCWRNFWGKLGYFWGFFVQRGPIPHDENPLTWQSKILGYCYFFFPSPWPNICRLFFFLKFPKINCGSRQYIWNFWTVTSFQSTQIIVLQRFYLNKACEGLTRLFLQFSLKTRRLSVSFEIPIFNFKVLLLQKRVSWSICFVNFLGFYLISMNIRKLFLVIREQLF